MESTERRCLRKHGSVETYKITYNNQPAYEKIQRFATLEESHQFIKEISNLFWLKKYPQAIQILHYTIEETKDCIETKIITEYCENGDLQQFLNTREYKGLSYSTSEITGIMQDLIYFFQILQSNKVSHRDIKPENIFITREGSFKIGDFGSSTTVRNQNNFTITGTPYYYSPELREHISEIFSYQKRHYAEYNPFKSDVFSLGLVFLRLTTQDLGEEFQHLDTLDAGIRKRLKSIRDIRIRMVIREMLKISHEKRPDFLKLWRIMQEVVRGSLCIMCWKKEREMGCRWCRNKELLQKGFQGFCRNFRDSSQRCSRCSGLVKELTCRLHQFCEGCRLDNLECRFCMGFAFVDREQVLSLEISRNYYCYRCFTLMDLHPDGQVYGCRRCCFYFCSICKCLVHPAYGYFRTCENVVIVCKCNSTCRRHCWEMFFECDNCMYVCTVCLGNYTVSHIACALRFQTDGCLMMHTEHY